MNIRILLQVFLVISLSPRAHAQVFLRTETVNQNPVQVYGATVVVKIHGSHPADLEKAKEQRQTQYLKIKKLASDLATTRISSLTTLQDSEHRVNQSQGSHDQSKFEENFNETTHSSAVADIEIKPIHETVIGKLLKTEIELWVSPVPVLPGTLDQYPEMLTQNELFDHIHIANGQKYLISLKKDILFDEGDCCAVFDKVQGKSVQISQSNLPEDFDQSFFYRGSRDLMTFSTGSFVGELFIVDNQNTHTASVLVTFARGGEKFSIRLFNAKDNPLPNISQMISMIKNHQIGSAGFDDYFAIAPVYQSFTPRVIH